MTKESKLRTMSLLDILKPKFKDLGLPEGTVARVSNKHFLYRNNSSDLANFGLHEVSNNQTVDKIDKIPALKDIDNRDNLNPNNRNVESASLHQTYDFDLETGNNRTMLREANVIVYDQNGKAELIKLPIFLASINRAQLSRDGDYVIFSAPDDDDISKTVFHVINTDLISKTDSDKELAVILRKLFDKILEEDKKKTSGDFSIAINLMNSEHFDPVITRYLERMSAKMLMNEGADTLENKINWNFLGKKKRVKEIKNLRDDINETIKVTAFIKNNKQAVDQRVDVLKTELLKPENREEMYTHVQGSIYAFADANLEEYGIDKTTSLHELLNISGIFAKLLLPPEGASEFNFVEHREIEKTKNEPIVIQTEPLDLSDIWKDTSSNQDRSRTIKAISNEINESYKNPERLFPHSENEQYSHVELRFKLFKEGKLITLDFPTPKDATPEQLTQIIKSANEFILFQVGRMVGMEPESIPNTVKVFDMSRVIEKTDRTIPGYYFSSLEKADKMGKHRFRNYIELMSVMNIYKGITLDESMKKKLLISAESFSSQVDSSKNKNGDNEKIADRLKLLAGDKYNFLMDIFGFKKNDGQDLYNVFTNLTEKYKEIKLTDTSMIDKMKFDMVIFGYVIGGKHLDEYFGLFLNNILEKSNSKYLRNLQGYYENLNVTDDDYQIFLYWYIHEFNTTLESVFDGGDIKNYW